MFNKAIQNLAEKSTAPQASPASWVEPEWVETELQEPEGKEETMLSPLPARPVDVNVWTSKIKNPA